MLALLASAVVAGSAPVAQITSVSPEDVAVVDGNTLVIAHQRIRLADVAAPATAQRCDTGRSFIACGVSAKAALAGVVSGKNVTCTLVGVQRSSWVGVADELIGRCWVAKVDLAEFLVSEGVAVPAPGSLYSNAGLSACVDHRGIWAGAVESPWTFRARREGRAIPPVLIGALAKTPCLRAIEAPNLR